MSVRNQACFLLAFTTGLTLVNAVSLFLGYLDLARP